MATQVQLRRGTATENNSFTGAQGELTFDTTNKRVRIHDGATAGGFELKTENSSGNTLFADNEKAIFGAGSDLQIYHDGNDSIIKESGAGHLRLLGDDIKIRDVNNAEMYIDAVKNGTVGLYYDNSAKLNTTSTGVDITGTLTSDGLTVDGDGTFSATNPTVDIKATNGNDASLILMETTGNDFGANGANGFRSRYDGGDNALYIQSGAETTIRNRIKVDRDTGDISFYEDTGTTAKFFWDASAERLGLGTTSPNVQLKLEHATRPSVALKDLSTNNELYVEAENGVAALNAYTAGTGARVPIVFKQYTDERMRIDSSGNVGIGTSSNLLSGSNRTTVSINNSSSAAIAFGVNGAREGHIYSDTSALEISAASNPMRFTAGDSERMRIDSSGNVGIGTSSPSSLLTVHGSQPIITLSDPDTGSTSTISGNSGHLILNADSGSNASNNTIDFQVDNSQKMRIDSSGNLLVGTTNTNTVAASGFTVQPDGQIFASSASQQVLTLTRRVNDGDIATFRNSSGTTVGSIGTYSSNITIGTGSTGLRFYNDDNVIMPRNPSTGASVNGTISLGEPLNRFKDLHLSGSIEIENGTGNVGVGKQALNSNTSNNNTALGYQAGYSQTTAEGFGHNTFIGYYAGYSTTGARNSFLGAGAGNAVTSGARNTIIGRYNGNEGGLDIRTLSNNIVLSDGDGNPRGYYHGGLASPLWKFQTPTINQNSMHIDNTSSSPYGPAIRLTAADPNNTSNYFLSCQGNGIARFIVYSNGNAQNTNNSYTGISDVKLKENIVDSGSQWDDIKALRVRKYSLKEQNATEPTQIGVIAQEVEAAGMSGLVTESPDRDAENNDLGTVTKAVQYSILYMKAVKALQEAMDRIETLEAKVTALENA